MARHTHDPSGTGASLGAPADEYDDEAARLAAVLARAKASGDVGRLLEQRYPVAFG